MAKIVPSHLVSSISGKLCKKDTTYIGVNKRSSWWKQNRPSATSAKGTEAYLAVMKAYKAQHKIGNPYSFMRSLVTDDLKVMLADNDLTGGVKPGGSTTEGGGQKPGGELES